MDRAYTDTSCVAVERSEIKMPRTELVTSSPTRAKTLDDYAKEFLAGFLNALTRKNYASDLRHFLAHTKGNLSDESILVYRELLCQDAAARTANRRLNTVKGFLESLVVKGLIPRNPLASVKRLGPSIDRLDSPTIALTDDEVKAMLDWCTRSIIDAETVSEANLGMSRKLSLVMGLYLGMRVSEVVNLRIQDVSEGKIKIRGKGNKMRIMHLDEVVLGEFTGYLHATGGPSRDGGEFLLKSRESDGTKAVETDTVNRWWGQVARACGIEKRVTSHVGRATVITKLLDSEVPIRDVCHFAGHSSPDTTLIYDKRRGTTPERVTKRIKY